MQNTISYFRIDLFPLYSTNSNDHNRVDRALVFTAKIDSRARKTKVDGVTKK